MYAAGRPHPYKASCVRVLDLLARGEIEANIDTEVIQEVMYRFWSQDRHEEAIGMSTQLVAGFPNALAITATTMKTAINLFASVPAIGPRDAIHAAVTIENDLEGIITTDSDFDAIPGITRFDPMEL
jgi:uncharacterized protein